MTSPHSSNEGAANSAADQAQIDQLCDDFEAEWKRLVRPQIEEYLDGVDVRLRSQLLEELVRIDHHWRLQESDPDVIRKEYARRFPGDTELIGQWLGSSQAGDASALPGQTSLGPFLNLRRIGEGGFGVVFRAWDSRHQRDVALKIPRFGHELLPQDLSRFLREAKAAGSLDHPGIARVWDSGTTAGVSYIAYQFIDGENLKLRFDEFAKRDPVEIAAFVRRLAEAVHFAHEHDIVHRDIKPSNILLGSDDRPVLTDFGLALATGADATRSLAARVGTLDYMSPEQASGASASVDGRTDLWSLGVLLHELLVGQRPFQADSDVELLRTIQQDEPRRLRAIDPSVPLDLDVLVMRCLQKQPHKRLPSCGSLAEELERVERGEPIRSRPISFVERALRWSNRNRRAVATFGLILLATVFGTWSWSGWLVSNSQNESQVQQLQIRIETGNARRREMLREILKRDTPAIRLAEEDLLFVERVFLATGDPAMRRHAAVVLMSNQHFATERFPRGTERQQECVESIGKVLADGGLDEETARQLRECLKRISAD